MIQQFKTFVDNTVEQISLAGDSIEDYYRYVSVNPGQNLFLSEVQSKLKTDFEAILDNTNSETDLESLDVELLEKLLVYESVLENIDNWEYLNITSQLKQLNKPLKPFSDTHSWKRGIQHIKDKIHIEQELNSDPDTQMEMLRERFPRHFDVANAANELRSLGCQIYLEENSIKYVGLEKIAMDIEEDIKKLGGITVMNGIFNYLEVYGHYNNQFNRFIITRQLGPAPHHTEPLTPYGYLLNLAAKYPFETVDSLVNAKKIEVLVNQAKLLSTIEDVQSYNKFDNIFTGVKDFEAYIRNTALFDTIFTFPSTDFNDVVDINKNLFKWVDNSVFESQYGFTIDMINKVSEAINKMANRVGPIYIYLSKLKKQVDLPLETIQKILTSISHEIDTVNRDFIKMSEYNFINFGEKPLIKITATKYLLYDKSWCATAFYEVIASLVRNQKGVKDQSNNEIGVAIEKYVYQKLEEKNISFINGNYVDGTPEKGEVDLLIESPKAITLLEMKKKGLTRLAKSGDQLKLVIDLAKSLFNAQIQAGRTEILLRKDNKLSLTEKTEVRTVNFEDRQIERIALTLWDFGSFQDRMVINKILSMLSTKDVSCMDTDSLESKNIKDIQSKQVKWKTQAEELSKIDPTFNDFPFFNCWFLSLPQLLLILKYCDSNERFEDALLSTKHVSFSANNFYFDFWHFYAKGKLVKSTLR